MRYLGNKDSIKSIIKTNILKKINADKDSIFFDAFCGMGSIANEFKTECKVIINDNLKCATTYTYGRLVASKCLFQKLGFDPFDFLNSSTNVIHGYFYNTYSPSNSNKRMYFTPENAGRIDFFRETIEDWKNNELISSDEYQFLLACLLESVSAVSNTAGVYGAFLKKWDDRALKNIEFLNISDNVACNQHVEVYSDKIEDIIEDVKCDILYLDPPYTQNQYGTQYHLLETLVLNDKPKLISSVTGSRRTSTMRSDWSKIYKVHILFDKVVATTRSKHIFLSYNNAGDMSKEYIESVMKRYGYEDSFECIKIPYKKYENWKSNNNNEHYEYLFYIAKKPSSQVIYESPLNYIGSKAKVIPFIRKYIKEERKFVDVFGGGLNVGINMNSDITYYNDINFIVKRLIESFKTYDTYEYIRYVKKIIEKFGLEKGNKDNYLLARNWYNNLPEENKDIRMLFTIILYSYQQQIRFNGNFEYNNPAGIRWFNDCILAKLISFSREVKRKDIRFISSDYINLENDIDFSKNSFLYLDPPYKLTTGSYNDGKRGFKGWNDMLEQELFDYIDSLTERNIPCMLSYVIEHKGEINTKVENWVQKKHYKCVQLGDITGISGKPRKEVLILNYEI